MRGFLGLGSNQGERLANLRAAREGLRRRGIDVRASSSVWETAPQGEVTEQRDFLNACLEIETELSPDELLAACKAVEGDLGRPAGGRRHGPRPIDVDLLLLDDLELRSERLTLPHSDLSRRRFVVEPLLELDPELRVPDGTRLADVLPGLRAQRAERVAAL